MTDAFYLSGEDRDKLRAVIKSVNAGNGSSRPLPRRRRGPRSLPGTSGTMLLVTISQNIASDVAVFPVIQSYYEVLFGSEGRATIQVDNSIFRDEFAVGEIVPVWKREADGLYVPDRTGASAPIVEFELTQDMALADQAVQAKPLLPNRDLDGNADAFYVVDDEQRFVGKAAWNDTAGAEHGYRGWAIRYTSDYTGGVPGYRILTMDGPMRWLVVTLRTDYDAATLPVVGTPENLDRHGLPFNGRRPQVVSGAGTIDLHDPHGVGEGGKQGDKWAAIYDEVDDQYILFCRLEPAGYHRARGKITTTITRGMTTATFDQCEAVTGREPPEEITATIPDYAPLDVPASYTGWIYVRWNERVGTDEASHWDTADLQNLDFALRGKADFDSTKYQAFVSDGPDEADRKWVEAVEQTIFLADPAPTITLSNPTSTSLRVKLDGQKRLVRVIPSAAATALSVQGDISGTDCST